MAGSDVVWAPEPYRPGGVPGCQWHNGGLWRWRDVKNAGEAKIVREAVRTGLFVDSSAQERRAKGVMKHLRHLLIDPIPQARIAALKLFNSIAPAAKLPASPAGGRANASGDFTPMPSEVLIAVFDMLRLRSSWLLAMTCKRLWRLRSEAAVAERAPLIDAVATMLKDGPPRLHTGVRAHPAAAWGEKLTIEVRPAMLPPRTNPGLLRSTVPYAAGIVDFVKSTTSNPNRRRPPAREVKKFLQKYCETVVVDSRSVQFEVEGRRIGVGDTYDDIGLRCDDSIGVGLADEHRRQALWVVLCHCSPAERDPYEDLLPKLGGIWLPEGVCPHYGFRCWPAD